MEKFNLPQDKMTPAQLKQRNGEVEVYSLGKPMKWRELEALPANLRKEYLERLRDEYHASQVMVADMLDISVHTFRKRCKKWGIKFQPNGGHLNGGIMARWSEFLGGECRPVEKPTAAEETQQAEMRHPAHLVPSSGSMKFHGPASDALRTMGEALRDTPCSLIISWEVEE